MSGSLFQAYADRDACVAGLAIELAECLRQAQSGGARARHHLAELLHFLGRKMAEHLGREERHDIRGIPIPEWECGAAVPSDESIVLEHNWNEVRTCMWDYVGIVRSDKRLERAGRRIRNLRQEIRQYYLDYLVTPDILELRNIADVGELIIRSAQARKETRGLHYTLDYPEPDDAHCRTDTVICDPPGHGQ